MLDGYVDAARDAGFTTLSANDHLVWQRPSLDGIVALARVVDRSADPTLATTVALRWCTGQPRWPKPPQPWTSCPAAGSYSASRAKLDALAPLLKRVPGAHS